DVQVEVSKPEIVGPPCAPIGAGIANVGIFARISGKPRIVINNFPFRRPHKSSSVYGGGGASHFGNNGGLPGRTDFLLSVNAFCKRKYFVPISGPNCRGRPTE